MQLMEYAAQKEYYPVCIGLYRSKINILYYENGQKINREWENETNQGELNEIIYDIIQDIEQKGHNTKRPFILFGNYKPTGESITMVNYKYGTLRMVAILPGIQQTPEKDYQNYLRCCYTTKKFIEHDPTFACPPKWIIGEKQCITNAINYELKNDKRIDDFENETNHERVLVADMTPSTIAISDSTNVAPPGKFVCENSDCDEWCEIRSIFVHDRRTHVQKNRVYELMKLMVENDDATVSFNNEDNPFSTDGYLPTSIRTFKNKYLTSGRTECYYVTHNPFEKYDANWKQKTNYLNEQSLFNRKEFEILAAYDRYEGINGKKYNKTVVWIGYKL